MLERVSYDFSLSKLIKIFLCMLPHIRLVLQNILCVLEKNVYSEAFRLNTSLWFNKSNGPLKTEVSSLFDVFVVVLSG